MAHTRSCGAGIPWEAANTQTRLSSQRFRYLWTNLNLDALRITDWVLSGLHYKGSITSKGQCAKRRS